MNRYITFLKVLDLNSITKAAEALDYTQSAVSQMIQSLEKELQLNLIRRSRNGVTLTDEGRKLLPSIERTVNEYNRLLEKDREILGLEDGLIRIGTFDTVANMWMPELLATFGREYPNIEFDLFNSERYGEIEDWIRQGKVDCGFVCMPTVNDLRTWFLKRDMLVAALPPDHPMAAEPVFPVAKLEGESVIKLKVAHEICRFLDQLAAPPELRYGVSSDHAILSMVEHGLGISIMHSLMAGKDRYKVVWKELDEEHYRDIGIATAKNVRLPSAARLFVEHVRRYAEKL